MITYMTLEKYWNKQKKKCSDPLKGISTHCVSKEDDLSMSGKDQGFKGEKRVRLILKGPTQTPHLTH